MSDELDLRNVAIAEDPTPKEYQEYEDETTDDIEVVAAKEETVANTVPYAAVASAFVPTPIVQTPVAHAPVAYYAPYHGYQPATASVPVTYQTAPVAAPVSAPAPAHSQFHAQVIIYHHNDI